MAIYLSRKKGGTVATPITPSNASPALMTANVAVNPTGNGYAIESYSSITPSSTPTQVVNNQIVKVGGTGIIIDDIPVPPSITPSNGSPAQLYGNTAVTPTRNGYAIESYTNITPDNTNPPNLLSGGIYKNEANFRGYAVKSFTNMTPKNNPPQSFAADYVVHFDTAGYAIASYENKTPSDSSPASVSSGAIIKASASGYLYQSSGLVNMVNIASSASKDTNFTLSSGNTTTVSVTSKPRLILWFQGNYGSGISAGYGEMGMYDGINNRYRRVTFYSGGANTATDGGDISSVTSSTVSFKNNGSSSRRYHVMMWY